jgi:PAS domain S-box-containing protein
MKKLDPSLKNLIDRHLKKRPEILSSISDFISELNTDIIELKNKNSGKVKALEELQKNKEELEKNKAELERIIDERTAELREINEDLYKEIEERVKSEEEVKASGKYLADIINCLPEPTFAIDRDGRVIAWNKAIEHLTGVKEDDILGYGEYEYSMPFYGDRQPILIDYVLDQDPDILEKYSVISHDGDSPIAESYIRGLRPGGSYIWEQARPLYDSSGEIIGCVETVRDITDRKKSEENMRDITKQALYHQIALQEISRLDNTDFDTIVSRITESTTRTLELGRTSVWLIDETSSALICRDRYLYRKNLHHSGTSVKPENYLNFIRIISDKGMISAADTASEHDLAGLAECVLIPDGVVSGLYIALRMSGRVCGFLACESLENIREWTMDEQDFASSISDIITLSLEATERRKAEVALQRQIKFTANLIDNLAVPVFVIDRDGMVMLWNKACELMTGIRSSDMIGTDYHWKAFYKEKRDTLADIVLRQNFDSITHNYNSFSPSAFIENGWHAEGRYNEIGGERRYMLFDAVPIYDNEGAIIASVEILQDITPLKNAEQETLRMRGFLKNIIDSMPSILIGVDTDGRIIHWNLEAERATSIKEENAQGRFLADVYPFLNDRMEKVTRAIEEKKAQKSERIMRTSPEGPSYYDVIVYPLISNGVQGAVIRVDDITSRVRIEEMMVQTEKMMSVGGLAAGMAHEINNPLGGIMIGAQNLQRRLSADLPKNLEAAAECGIDMESLKRYMEGRDIYGILQGILSMGERASKIVSNMLRFSRKSDSGKVAVMMNEIVENTLELAANDYDLKKRYDFRQINIVREYDSGLPEIYCSPTEIQQVILNLLKNAAQAMFSKEYTEGESPLITIRIILEGGFMVIEIEDNGPGMDEHTKKRVFEPFFTTKEVGSGTGLGLSVSYFIITDTHRGSMDLRSSPGDGSAFIIKLPLERAEE